METITQEKTRLTLTDLLRVRFKGVLDPIGRLLNRTGLTPNTMTILGLFGNAVGAYFLALGNFTLGGIIILLMGPVDALDGTMARLRGEPTKFGGFVDSVTDRYSELIIFAGMLYFYLQQGDPLASMLIFAAAAGSVLVSYVRARGQSLGWDTKVGLLTRFERYIVLAPSLIFNLPIVGLWIIAIFGNITALQRILDVRRQAHSTKK